MTYDNDLDRPPYPFADDDEPDRWEWVYTWRGLVALLVGGLVFGIGMASCLERAHDGKWQRNQDARQSCVERHGHPIEDQYGWFTECHW